MGGGSLELRTTGEEKRKLKTANSKGEEVRRWKGEDLGERNNPVGKPFTVPITREKVKDPNSEGPTLPVSLEKWDEQY